MIKKSEKLGKYILEISEKTTVNNQYEVLTSSQDGIVYQSNYFSKQIASKDNVGYKIIRNGQFTYRAMSDTGRFYINQLKNCNIGIVSPAYPVFEIKPNSKLLPEYLQEYFRSELFQNSISLQSSGSTRVSLKLNKLKELEIVIPPLEEQKNIVFVLSKISDLIAKRKQQLEKLDLLVKSKFVEMFGDPISNSYGWQKNKLGNNCKIITGNTPSRAEIDNYGTYIEWIKSDNINTPYTYITKAQEFLSEKGFEKCRYVDKGSILMTCIAGSINCIGNVAITDRCVAFNQQINAIIPMCDNVFYLYWLFIMSKPYIHSTINMSLKGILSKGQLSEIEFMFPPIELQNQFADFVKQTEKTKTIIGQSLEKLETLKKALMQEYFN